MLNLMKFWLSDEHCRYETPTIYYSIFTDQNLVEISKFERIVLKNGIQYNIWSDFDDQILFKYSKNRV